jgi:hypothetical protein
MINDRGRSREPRDRTNTRSIASLGISQVSNALTEISSTLEHETFASALSSQCRISSVNSRERQTMSPEKLANNWGIGLEAAKRTIEKTTQRGIRSVANPSISRRFRTNDRSLRYRRLKTNVFTDTMFSSVPSSRGNTCAQIYCNDLQWTAIYPMKSKKEAHLSLSSFMSTHGAPDFLISDGAKEMTQGDFRRKAREAGVHCKEVEPYSPWSNMAEAGIRELKRATRRAMLKRPSPKDLWDYCIELQATIRSNTAHDLYQLESEVPATWMGMGTSDISNICEYGWYEWIYYRDEKAQFPNDSEVLGRYLGPAPDVGGEMCMRILNITGKVRHRSTIRHLTPAELLSETNKKARDDFDTAITETRGPSFTKMDFTDEDTPEYESYEDEDSGDSPRMPEADDHDIDAFDNYLSGEVILPTGDDMLRGTVKSRKRDTNGNLIGKANQNPILDTRVYHVEFPDGHTEAYSANVIAENMYAQVDEEGHTTVIMDEIVDHMSDASAVAADDLYVTTKNGKKHMRRTTKGWKLCVLWKDGSTSWERLADLKECNPVKCAEYAVANKLTTHPAFAWWVPFTLKSRNRIIAAVSNRYSQKTHKFGIEMPKTAKEAIAIDLKNGNTHWFQAISKEMKNVKVAFNILEEEESIPVGYKFIPCHMIFDVKMDFSRKARYVAGGHTTDPPNAATYASVVSRESVRIALMIAALNDLEIMTADIRNAYLNAPVAESEKYWTSCGPEFGPTDNGKRAVIIRALYGLKSAGASFRNHLATCMRALHYVPCEADPDVWMRPATRESDGFEYWEYVLIYTDDLLVVSENPKAVLDKIDNYFPLKSGSITPPDVYLGAKISKYPLKNGVVAWAMSSSQYVQEAVKNVELYLSERGMSLPGKAITPLTSGYRPELDVSAELDPERANYYMSLIGILRWSVEIGRMDITCEVSMMSSHMALPREGHLTQLFHMFAYLKKKHNSRMVFDPSYPFIDEERFRSEEDWKVLYGDVKEAIPPNAPEPRGKEVVIRHYVDADHAGERLTRRSRTGYITFLNMAPMNWFSKRQNSVETSTFGSEFTALKVVTEANRGLRYKLRMLGIPVPEPSYIFCDNNSVVCNTTAPESTLKKKSNAIAYHCVREAVAMREILIAYEPTDTNLSDIMTKALPGGERRERLVRQVLYDI